MSQFAFVPRKLAKIVPNRHHGATLTSAKPSSSTPNTTPSTSNTRRHQQCADPGPSSSSSKPTALLPDETYATLLKLALSDYALWHDIELRKTVGNGEDGCKRFFHLSPRAQKKTKDSRLTRQVISLRNLMRISHVFVHDGMAALPPETVLVRAIREHASDVLEARMNVVQEIDDGWQSGSTGNKHSKDTRGGGYEIRRKDYTSALTRIHRLTTRYWDSRTIYVVRSLSFLVIRIFF